MRSKWATFRQIRNPVKASIITRAVLQKTFKVDRVIPSAHKNHLNCLTVTISL